VNTETDRLEALELPVADPERNSDGELDVIALRGGHWSMHHPQHVNTVCDERRRIPTRTSRT